MNLNKMRKHNHANFANIQIREFSRFDSVEEIVNWREQVHQKWLSKYPNENGTITISRDDLPNNKVRITMKLRRPNEAQIPPL